MFSFSLRFIPFFPQAQFPGVSHSHSIFLLFTFSRSFSDPSSAVGLWAITLSVTMSAGDQKPLPFVYQFAAGAVAGVSEVRVPATDILLSFWTRNVDGRVFTNSIVLLWFRFLLCRRNLIYYGFDIGEDRLD